MEAIHRAKEERSALEMAEEQPGLRFAKEVAAERARTALDHVVLVEDKPRF